MSSIVIAGDTSGSVTLQAPAVSGSTILTLPATSGTIQTSGAGYTTNGVAYATSATGLATGSALTFDGTFLNANGLRLSGSDASNTIYKGSGALGITCDGPSIDIGANNASGYTTFSIASSERMRLTSTGLGIGTSSPASKLDISGGGTTAKFNTLDTYDGGASLSAWMKVGRRAGTGTNAYINTLHSGSDAVSALTWAFGTSGTGTEVMRLESSGNLLVGTTSTAPASGNVVGFAVGSSGYISVSRNAGLSAEFNRIGNNGDVIALRQAGTQVGSISVTASATAYNTSSDYRLKNSVAPMTGALAKVALLKPVTYKWNADGSNGEGFIAHELAEVVPDCVSGEKDAVETYVDEDGNEQTRPVYQGIDTSFLVATLTAAIQEMKTIIDDQAARLTVLENK